MLSSEQVQDILRQTGAMLTGHFLLSSGLHSPMYIQCALVFQHPGHAERLAVDMAGLFTRERVDAVISPAVGGIVTGQEVGRALGVRAIFAEREEGSMRLRRGFQIQKGERFLVVDDVITRGGSVGELIELVRSKEGAPVGIAVVVDRSGGDLSWDVPLRSLVQLEMITHQPQECPLCRAEIPLVKPGSKKHQAP